MGAVASGLADAQVCQTLLQLAEGGHPETNPFLHRHAMTPARRQPAGIVIKSWQLVLLQN